MNTEQRHNAHQKQHSDEHEKEPECIGNSEKAKKRGEYPCHRVGRETASAGNKRKEGYDCANSETFQQAREKPENDDDREVLVV